MRKRTVALFILAAIAAIWLLFVPRPAAEGERAAPPPLEGFAHAPDRDFFGYYFAEPPVRIGDLHLHHLHIGSPREFGLFEGGGERLATYAPLMLQFDDETTARGVNELGQTWYEVSHRVLPSAYRVFPDDVRFAGTHDALGPVGFTGRFEQGSLAGTLTVGGETFAGLTFRHHAGD